jgi:hypothetical protein
VGPAQVVAGRCKTPRVRIGTWNLDAKWSCGHAAILSEADCDVWLLTEVSRAVDLAGYTTHRCLARMSRGQHYAGVTARLPLGPQPDPHPATAAARIGELTFYSSVLPWPDPDDPAVWGHGNQAQRTQYATSVLQSALVSGCSVWGGDFNHALAGPTRWAGSTDGRSAITELTVSLGIDVPTAHLPHRKPGIRSIDHIGVPAAWTIIESRRVEVPNSLSDHDAYVVDTLS